MSSQPNPVTEATAPFIPVTTPAIERANRLMSVRAHPGFNDIIRLSQEMVQESIKACISYPGWDKDMIVFLKVRMQAASDHHEALLARINNAIEQGIAEAQVQRTTLPDKTPQELIEQGDYVRTAVLSNFEEMDGRAAGSY